MRKERNKKAPVTRKTWRIPINSDKYPPSNGPSKEPLTPPVEIVEIAQPECSFGVSAAINVIAVERKPDTAPIKNLECD